MKEELRLDCCTCIGGDHDDHILIEANKSAQALIFEAHSGHVGKSTISVYLDANSVEELIDFAQKFLDNQESENEMNKQRQYKLWEVVKMLGDDPSLKFNMTIEGIREGKRDIVAEIDEDGDCLIPLASGGRAFIYRDQLLANFILRTLKPKLVGWNEAFKAMQEGKTCKDHGNGYLHRLEPGNHPSEREVICQIVNKGTWYPATMLAYHFTDSKWEILPD